MFKKLIGTIVLFLALPVFAGNLEDALMKNNKVFLYMYTDNCTYCNKFSPIHEKLFQKYSKKIEFVKVDIASPYGKVLAQRFGIFYVPSVVLLDYKKHTMRKVEPTCLLDYMCIKNAMDELDK